MLALALTLAVLPAMQQPQPGISRDLARVRAKTISEVAYELRLTLGEGTEEVEGRARILFTLDPDSEPNEPLVLDFAGAALDDVRMNGIAQDSVTQVNGHVVIPATSLAAGRNTFAASFRSAVAPTGTPLTVYRDPTDGSEYYYTLVVPADAHRLFPCFDQPDLKATFQLDLDVPQGWTAVANGAVQEDTTGDELFDGEPQGQLVRFLPSRRIPTYLMAFATGPFAVTEDDTGAGVGENPDRRLRMFHRASRGKDLEAARLFKMHRDSLRWLEDYFGVPYPFAKLDLVLVPGFPYGGMEHAGAIFYRERALVFDNQPTESELTRRSTLIYHELSHQWFGNLVTMEWFDDLWLKEGFATFIGYRCMNVLEPERKSWLRFHQRVKPRAYQVDATRGTTPVFQQLRNLADAKSAYGAIVYNKAPAVLRQLDAQLGSDRFRAGMTAFLRRHSYANARWQDLVTALEETSGEDLSAWSSRWILAPGMPRVRVTWELGEDDKVRAAHLEQESVQGEANGAWPLQVELLVWDAEGQRQTLAIATGEQKSPVPVLVGKPAPRCVLLNPGDEAYGQFLLNSASRDHLVGILPEESDPLVRAVALSALWETVREAQMDPARFAKLAADLVLEEKDPESHAWLLGRLQTCYLRYLDPERAAPLRDALVGRLLAQLAGGLEGRALQTFRFLARVGRGDGVEELCRNVATGKAKAIPAGQRDRFLAAAALLAGGDGKALQALTEELAGKDFAKDAYLARAATRDAASKKSYFDSYLQLGEPPEQWMQDSLSFFHWPGHEELALPYLEPALDRLMWVKANRKIFFMPAWIDGFANGHSSAEALRTVDAVLMRDDLPEDIRKKIEQSVDGLRRTVRIRARW